MSRHPARDAVEHPGPEVEVEAWIRDNPAPVFGRPYTVRLRLSLCLHHYRVSTRTPEDRAILQAALDRARGGELP